MVLLELTPTIKAALDALSEAIKAQYAVQGCTLSTVHVCGAVLPVRDGKLADDAPPAILGTTGNEPESLFLVGQLMLASAISKSEEDHHVH